MREADFQAGIIQLAELLGWRVYHVARVTGHLRAYTSRGYPDLTLCRPPRLIFAEIKMDRHTSKPTAEQDIWLAALREVADSATNRARTGPPIIDVCVWRPQDWPEIEETLRRREAPA